MNDWYKDFHDKRQRYGISQSQLALECGVSRAYLNQVEMGKKKPSDELKDKMERALEKYNPEKPLDLLFDYVRIRFPTTNVKRIIETLLKIDLAYMAYEARAFYGYEERYYYGDVVVMVSPDDSNLGVLLELKGGGCRQFEHFLQAQERSWYDFFLIAWNMKLTLNDWT